MFSSVKMFAWSWRYSVMVLPTGFLLVQRNYHVFKVLLPFAAIASATKTTFPLSLAWPFMVSLCSISHFRLTRTVPPSKHKVVVITGCDSGLGYSLSVKCREMGLCVVSGCLNLESPGAKDLLQSNSGRVLGLDVTKPNSIAAFTQDVGGLIEAEHLELHAVVNNAGMMVFGEFEWQTDEQMTQQVQVNQLGTFRVAKAFLPLLRQHKGRLMNVASHCATCALPALSIYGSTKAAISNWSEGLRLEQANYGVKIITFIPGSFILQSNIMSRQQEYADIMKKTMSQDEWDFHGDYFTQFNDYLSHIPSNKTLACIKDVGLYKQFEKALLEVRPKSVYVHEPWRYYIYYRLFKITFGSLRDFLIHKFVNFPTFKPKQ